MSFADAIYKQKTAILIVLGFIFVAGSITYQSIPREMFPQVKIPIVYVSIFSMGTSPEDADKLIIRPIEKKLSAAKGIKKITSTSAGGMTNVIAEFTSQTNPDDAVDEVRNKVAEARPDMPRDIDEPVINEIDFARLPILNIALTGDVPMADLIKDARFISDRIEEIPSVNEVVVVGERKDILRCEVDTAKWFSYALSVGEVAQKIDANNKLIPVGEVKNKQNSFAIKIPGLVQNKSDVSKIPLRNTDGKTISIADICNLSEDFEEASQLSRVNFQPAVTMEVSKRSNANIISTTKKIRAVMSENIASLTPGVKVVYSRDASKMINERLDDLVNNVVAATILVIIIVIAQIGVRQSFIVASSIPVSFFLGLIAMNYMGYTLNIVVLCGFIMSVGMVVDASIIVAEYADFKMKHGIRPSLAFIDSAKRMMVPVLSATIGLIAVYMPLLFWPGVVGDFMKFIPITLICVLFSSILAAMVFVPILGGLVCDPLFNKNKKFFVAKTEDNTSKLTDGYVKLVSHVIERPVQVVIFSIAFFVVSIVTYTNFGKSPVFFTDVSPDYLTISIKSNDNISIDEKMRVAMEVEKIIEPMSQDIDVVYSKIGTQDSSVVTGSVAQNVITTITLQLSDWESRRKAEPIIQDLRKNLKGIAGVTIDVGEEKEGPESGKEIQARISAPTQEEINKASSALYEFMLHNQSTMNVSDSRTISKTEFDVMFDRVVANMYGIDLATFGNTVRMMTTGVPVGSYLPNGRNEKTDITLFFPQDNRNLKQLRGLRVPTPSGHLVSAETFVTITPQEENPAVEKINGLNIATISSDVMKNKVSVNEMVEEMKQWFKAQDFGKNTTLSFGGSQEDQEETVEFLKKAFAIAIFIKIAILIVQFNSIYYAMVVMSSIILSLAGVYWALTLTNRAFSIAMSGFGVISLAGIVVSSNIIFIDTYQRLLAEGVEKKKAILQTASERLRPILMTSATTVIGLIPMVANFNIDFVNLRFQYDSPAGQWWTQLSTTIAGGLICATVFTLFLTPSILMIYSPITKKSEFSDDEE